MDVVYDRGKKPTSANLQCDGVDPAEELDSAATIYSGRRWFETRGVVRARVWKRDTEVVQRALAKGLHAVLVAEAESGEQLVLRDAAGVNLEIPLPEVSDV